jgi:hypothetical protein
MEERIIVLKDCEARTYVETNAPRELIEDAIAYKDELLEQDVPIESDFDAIREYLNERGYTFEECEEDCEEYWW